MKFKRKSEPWILVENNEWQKFPRKLGEWIFSFMAGKPLKITLAQMLMLAKWYNGGFRCINNNYQQIYNKLSHNKTSTSSVDFRFVYDKRPQKLITAYRPMWYWIKLHDVTALIESQDALLPAVFKRQTSIQKAGFSSTGFLFTSYVICNNI